MKRLLEGQQLQRTVPPTAGRVEPVVHLPGGLTLDDRSCWQYPTMLVGNVGSGKSTLMEQIRRPVLAHADRVQDTVVIFAAKPDVLRCRRPGDPVISVSATDPASCWNLFRELDASDTPELTLREIASALFAEQKKKTTQIFFPEAAQEIFYQTARFMRDFGHTNNIPVSNAELSEFLTRTTVFAQEGAGTGTNGSWQELVERYPTYFSAARDLIGDGGAQGLGVLSEVRTMLSRLFIGSFNTADGRFSALQAIRQGGKRVFILYEPDKARTALPLFRLLLDLMLQQSMSPTLNHKVWFLLDEFSLLPKVESLTDFLSFARDPSGDNGRSGARIIAAVQSVQLLTRHYSEAEAKTLMSLFPNLITMRVMDPMSRAAFADRYGTARVIYRYMGEGNRPVTTDCEQKVVTDADFSKLPKVESLTDFLSFARDPSGDNGRSGARIIAAVQSVQLLTRHYSEAEAKTLMSLFPNLITMRVMDPMSRAAFADRYGTARVIYRYMGEGNRPVTTDCEQKVVTDADFSKLMKPGQTLMSLPAVSQDPFIYDGFRG